MTKVPQVQNLGDVHLIDTCHGGYPGTVGVYLLPGEGGSFALIETGPSSTLTTLEEGIHAAGFAPEALTDIVLTHIHFDHAGAAGTLARQYGANVYVHERGAPHLAAPNKLIASATRIYGDQMETLWGPIEPVPEAQLHALSGGERLSVLGHRLEPIYTPGHASHHLAFLLDGDSLFTGDAAAIRLPGSSVVRPALPPPEVNLELWAEGLERMRAAQAERLLLTHFGAVENVSEHLDQVAEHNRLWADDVLLGMQKGEDDDALEACIAQLSRTELEADGASPEVIERHRVTSNDEMTIMGLKRYWRKHHPEKLEGQSSSKNSGK